MSVDYTTQEGSVIEKEVLSKTEAFLQQLLQNASDAEKSLLSCLLQASYPSVRLCQELELLPEHFYYPAHQKLYRDLNDRVDAVTDIERDSRILIKEIKDSKLLEDLGIVPVMAGISDFEVLKIQLLEHLKTIKGQFMLRKHLHFCFNSQITASPDVDVFFADVVAMNHDFEQMLRDNKPQTIEDYVNISMDGTNRSINNHLYYIDNFHEYSDVLSGFSELDKLTKGFMPGELLVLATSDVFRTPAFLADMIEKICLDMGRPTLLFTRESRTVQFVQHLVLKRANFDTYASDFLEEESLERIKCAAVEIAVSKLFVEDYAGVSLSQLRSVVRRLKNENGIQIVLVNYTMSLISNGITNFSPDTNPKIDEFLKHLKKLAEELDIPVVVTCDINDESANLINHHNYKEFQSKWLSSDVDRFCVLTQPTFLEEYEYYYSKEGGKDSGDDSSGTAGHLAALHLFEKNLGLIKSNTFTLYSGQCPITGFINLS